MQGANHLICIFFLIPSYARRILTFLYEILQFDENTLVAIFNAVIVPMIHHGQSSKLEDCNKKK